MGRSVISPNYMSEILRFNPDSLLFARYAHTLIVSRKLNAAQKIAEEGVEKHPNYAGGRFILALCYAEQGDKRLAVLQLIEVLKIEPTFQHAMSMLVKLLSKDGVSETSITLVDYLFQMNPKTRLLGKLTPSGRDKKSTVFEIFSCEHNWKEYASDTYGQEKKPKKAKILETGAEDTEISGESSLGGSLEQEISEAIYQGENPAEEKNPNIASDENAESIPQETAEEKIQDMASPDIASDENAENIPQETIDETDFEIKIPPRNVKDIKTKVDKKANKKKADKKNKQKINAEIETAEKNEQITGNEDSDFLDSALNEKQEADIEIEKAEEKTDVTDITENPSTDSKAVSSPTIDDIQPEADEKSASVDDVIDDIQPEMYEKSNDEREISATVETEEEPIADNQDTDALDSALNEKQEADIEIEKAEENLEVAENHEDFSSQAVEINADSVEKDAATNEEFAEFKNMVEESIEKLPSEISLTADEKEMLENPKDAEISLGEIKKVMENEKDEISLKSPESEKNGIVSNDCEQEFTEKLSDTFDNSFEDYLKNSKKVDEDKQDAGELSEIALENITQKFDEDEQKAEPLSEKEAFGFLIAKNGGEQLPDHILTPTFAQIYLEQGQPYLAKQIYERLMMQDGGNEEFAEKIEEIDDIIERMKKGEHISFETLDFSPEKSMKRSLKGKRIKKEIREALIEKYFAKDGGEKDDEQA